jgi:hypothetical protein
MKNTIIRVEQYGDPKKYNILISITNIANRELNNKGKNKLGNLMHELSIFRKRIEKESKYISDISFETLIVNHKHTFADYMSKCEDYSIDLNHHICNYNSTICKILRENRYTKN